MKLWIRQRFFLQEPKLRPYNVSIPTKADVKIAKIWKGGQTIGEESLDLLMESPLRDIEKAKSL